MRTTLDIDTDVLQAAREIAGVQNSTAGKVLSDLARKGLEVSRSVKIRNGVPLLPLRPSGAPRTTMQLVKALRDES